MASFPSLYLPSSSPFLLCPHHNLTFFFLHKSFPNPPRSNKSCSIIPFSFRTSYRFSVDHEDEDGDGDGDRKFTRDFSFDEAVTLFNKMAYYECHDILETLWNNAEDPSRTLIHGILQCAVGLHHLFNRNHRGAMMELGEGVCKLRKMEFKSGSFHTFEREITAVLDFVYQTQIELAACDENKCVRMDGSERSYELLGGYAAGEHVYDVEFDGTIWIVFSPQTSHTVPLRVKLPTLSATKEMLLSLHFH